MFRMAGQKKKVTVHTCVSSVEKRDTAEGASR